MSLEDIFSEELETNDKVALVDLSQISLATVMHTYNEGDELNVNFVRHLVLSTLKHNVLKFRLDGYTKFILAVDNGKSVYWRRQFKDYYKRNRQESRDNSQWDWEGFYSSLEIVINEMIKYMPYYVIKVNHAEADDIIAVLTKHFTSKGVPVKLISSDGDFTQLHKFKGVTQYSPIQKKSVITKYGDPQLDLFYKIVKGDKKDNVAPITVRGDFHTSKIDGERCPPIKTDWLLDLFETYQKSEIEMSKKLTPFQYERFKENRVLIDFDYIREDIVENTMKAYNEYVPAKKGRIYSYFVKSGLSKLLKDINSF